MPKKIRRKRKTYKRKQKISFWKNRKLHYGLAIAVGFILLCITIFYIKIDRQVKTYLESSKGKQSASIYSAESSFSKGQLLHIDTVIKALNRHAYHFTSRKPKRAGEVRVGKYNLEIVSREFINANQELVQSKYKVFPVSKQYVRFDEKLYLEPISLSTLTKRSTKAIKYRPIELFPQTLKDAVLSVEDERFYKHFGIDLLSILRAVFVNLSQGRFAQGGSTITQQLAKNTLFTPKKTLKRKALESFAAISLERRLTKDQILELYLNEVYLGQSGSTAIHGIPAAAEFFFGKSLDDLNLSEIALLAGIIKAPSYYAPHRYLDRSKKRRNIVLDLMLKQNKISAKDFKQAQNALIKISPKKPSQSKAPYFLQTLRKQLEHEFGLDELSLGKMRVQTSIDYNLQSCAENALKNGLAQLNEKRSQPLSGGILALQTYSGLVKAWVGGADFRKKQFDHVSQARRQVGSTIKPFVYLTALDQDLNNYRVATPVTILTDEPLAIRNEATADFWTPKNYDGDFRGAVTLRYALEKSLNIPAAYVGQRVGAKSIANTINNFGIAKNPLPVPSLALGAVESTLLDLTAAYAALANGGIWIKPRLYTEIRTPKGEVYASSAIQERRVASEAPTYVITNILQGVLERGTARAVRHLGYQGKAAGKTGTTNDTRDAWFVGYTPNISAGVWVGYDDNSETGLTGTKAAVPIWGRFMKCASNFLDKDDFIPPPGITYVDLDSQTGRLYHSGCRGKRIKEIFVAGTEPLSYCDEDYRERPLPRQKTYSATKQPFKKHF